VTVLAEALTAWEWTASAVLRPQGPAVGSLRLVDAAGTVVASVEVTEALEQRLVNLTLQDIAELRQGR
jgi:hypothetical protein